MEPSCLAFVFTGRLFSVRSAINFLWLFNCPLRAMTQTSSANRELTRFRAILEVRIAELECRIGYRDGIAVEQSPDQVEEIQRASERALAVCNIDRESKQLRDTRAALRRIREGSFGVCAQCEEQIHPKRLLAIPWASLCIRCQQATDCGGEAASISVDILRSNAA
jgi:DnaK suppressor protein